MTDGAGNPQIVTMRLELRNITKAYPAVIANDDVSLEVLPGEIHAVLGENGAGKSTLMKVIYGVTKADAGKILWNGKAVNIPNPAQARRLGIGMVFQHFSLFETLTVAENIALAVEEEFDLDALSTRIRDATDCLWIRDDWFTLSRSANASASKSCAVCYRNRSCSSWMSPLRS